MFIATELHQALTFAPDTEKTASELHQALTFAPDKDTPAIDPRPLSFALENDIPAKFTVFTVITKTTESYRRPNLRY